MANTKKSNLYGSYLRDTRRRSGKTFEEIESAFGWSKSSLLGHEKAISHPPEFDRVLQLADFIEGDSYEMVTRLIKDRGEIILKVNPLRRDQVEVAAMLAHAWYKKPAGSFSSDLKAFLVSYLGRLSNSRKLQKAKKGA